MNKYEKSDKNTFALRMLTRSSWFISSYMSANSRIPLLPETIAHQYIIGIFVENFEMFWRMLFLVSDSFVLNWFELFSQIHCFGFKILYCNLPSGVRGELPVSSDPKLRESGLLKQEISFMWWAQSTTHGSHWNKINHNFDEQGFPFATKMQYNTWQIHLFRYQFLILAQRLLRCLCLNQIVSFWSVFYDWQCWGAVGWKTCLQHCLKILFQLLT